MESILEKRHSRTPPLAVAMNRPGDPDPSPLTERVEDFPDTIRKLDGAPAEPAALLKMPPPIPDVFRNNIARFASGQPLQAGIAAIFGKDTRGEGDRRWHDVDYGTYSVATYSYPSRKGGKFLVQPVMPYGPLDADRLGGELGWAVVRDVGIRTAWIHLILAAHSANLAEPTKDTFIITAHQLAEYLGYTGQSPRRKDKTLPEILKKMEEEMRLASAWGITIRQVHVFRAEEGKGLVKRTPYVIRELEDRLWNIAVAREYQGYLEDPEHGELRNVIWSVRPGQWAQYFLSPQGMREFGALARPILDIDPHHHRIAAKLAVYLQLQSRIKEAKGQPIEYEVGTILEAIHEFPVPQPGQSASAIRVHRHRVRHKLHEAIEEVLPDRGITVGGPSGRGYEWLTEGLRPGESNHGLSWGNWLKARVRFSLPEEQSQVARGMAERRRERLKRGSRKKANL